MDPRSRNSVVWRARSSCRSLLSGFNFVSSQVLGGIQLNEQELILYIVCIHHLSPRPNRSRAAWANMASLLRNPLDDDRGQKVPRSQKVSRFEGLNLVFVKLCVAWYYTLVSVMNVWARAMHGALCIGIASVFFSRFLTGKHYLFEINWCLRNEQKVRFWHGLLIVPGRSWHLCTITTQHN